MKKFIMLMLVVLSVSLFAVDLQPINDVVEKPATKDWVTYRGASAYTYSQPGERAVYFDADDFGFEYPVEFNAVEWYVYEGGINYHFTIYAKDGTTVLWTSADSLSVTNSWEMTVADTPVILSDDFYVALVPQPDGTPVTIHDDGSGTFGHSYQWVDSLGGFVPLHVGLSYEGVYNHSMEIDITPHVGADLYPPTAKGILGNETFMDQDAQIAIRIIDQSAVVSPVLGLYSFDGGTTWTPFNLTQSKDTYVFRGTIPGQVDGTVGVVRFGMEDALGYTSVSDEFDISWDKDNPILFEGFENVTFPPNGWTLDTGATGAGFVEGVITAGDAVHTGSKCAVHFDDNQVNDDWLISSLVTLPAANPSTLTFWQYADWLNYVGTGFHEIAVSTDAIAWNVIHTGHPDGGPTGIGRVWDFLSLSLIDYIGQDVYIGFRYVGEWEDIWYIDDVEILYDYEAPTIAGIMGNVALDPVVGAYLNNDMTLNLDVYDLSGVATVVGHYTFDGGMTIFDIDFAQAKGTEQWSGTIPAEAAVIAGTINFDLTDIGGLTTLTADYDIEFVLDTDAPVFTYVTGTEAFLNDPMNLTIAFTDESAITSCSGSYSKDGWITQYDFDLTPSKVNEYMYVGTIPAEAAEVLDGEVVFNIKDAEGALLTTGSNLVQWRDGQIEFFEDFESGFGNWVTDGNWAIVAEGEYTSADNALTESPGGDYLEDEISTVSLVADMDWSSYLGAKISFWCAYDIEHGFDYMYFDVTTDNGVTWTNLKIWDDEGIPWHEENISLDAFVGGTFNFRFRFESDGGYQANGMYIDDITLITYNTDVGPPLPVYAPYEPDFYQGVLGDYTNNVDILDISGIAAVEVIYSVDGAPQTNIVATLVAGDQWEFIIPAQAPGAVVEYTFWAQDASTNS
ncbi:MAG: choice-of-anchor J domain-containing protein, partial [Candidatus Delongbacteria bacterium]|nr:choice-of-anchor J domain-containing protein [Candidatus Delongbacteria bacterium]